MQLPILQGFWEMGPHVLIHISCKLILTVTLMSCTVDRDQQELQLGLYTQ